MSEVSCIWKIPARLGEGPLWVAQENALYWLDILQNQVHKLHVNNGKRQTWHFAEPITSMAVRQSGGLVASITKGFAVIDLTNLVIEPIVKTESDLPGNRFNDGKVDGYGRFWAGTMDGKGKQATGSLYRLDPDLTLHKMDSPYIISNGPTFSSDGQTLYHTDSVRQTIFAFDLHADGSLGKKRPFIQLIDPAEGKPDGMAVDSENCLWLAHFGGARLTRYSPAGQVMQVVPLPVPNVTSCTFGGDALDTLYITTASAGMSQADLEQYPLAGSLFAYRPGVTGLPTPQFTG
jgi:sugar lactone lactonase YvrE